MNAQPKQLPAEGGMVRALRILLPVLVLAAGLAAWELVVRAYNIPPYVLPGPVVVVKTLIND